MDTSEHEVLANPPAGGTRRALLRASLDGFALAVSRNSPLAGWEKAWAREGAYGGELGGRHGQDRRGRDRNRTHDRHRHRRDRSKGPDHEPSKGLFDNEGVLNIQFIFVNNLERRGSCRGS